MQAKLPSHKYIGKKLKTQIGLLFNFQLQKQLHDADHADGLHGQRVRQVGGRGQRDHQDVPERVGQLHKRRKRTDH